MKKLLIMGVLQKVFVGSLFPFGFSGATADYWITFPRCYLKKWTLPLSVCAAPKRRLAVGWRLTWNLVTLLWMDLVQIHVGCPLLASCCIGIQVQWKWVRIARAFLVSSTLYWCYSVVKNRLEFPHFDRQVLVNKWVHEKKKSI